MTKRGWLLFAAMGVIWGIPYALIKVAVRDVDPGTLVLFRTAIGALVLLPIAIARGDLRPVVSHWRPLLLYTACELAVPWLLISTAEQRLPSSLTGLLIAAVPLIGAGIARRLGGHEPIGTRGVTGLLVGLLGVGALVGFDVSGAEWPSVVMVGVAVVGYAAGPLILSRRLSALPPLGVVSGSLLISAIAYLPWGLTHLPPAHTPAGVWAAVAVLGLVCTAVAFVGFFALITEIGPVRATVITYVNPAVAVVIGVFFLNESFGVGTGIGFALILTGSILATRHRVAPAGGTIPRQPSVGSDRWQRPREHDEL